MYHSYQKSKFIISYNFWYADLALQVSFKLQN